MAHGVVRRGGEIHIYVQSRVPGVTRNLNGSQMLRYRMPFEDFAAHSRSALQELRQALDSERADSEPVHENTAIGGATAIQRM